MEQLADHEAQKPRHHHQDLLALEVLVRVEVFCPNHEFKALLIAKSVVVTNSMDMHWRIFVPRIEIVVLGG